MRICDEMGTILIFARGGNRKFRRINTHFEITGAEGESSAGKAKCARRV